MTAKIIPNYPNYSITEDGEVRNIKRDRVLINKTLTRYETVSLTNKNGLRTCCIHRLVYECFVLKEGETMPKCLDHIDNNTFNNAIINLRPATDQQNARNRLRERTTNSGHKNIYITKEGKFRVKIMIEKSISYSKNHKTLPLAIADAERVRLLYFGEFANNGIIINPFNII